MQQLDYLKARGWQGVSMAEALSNPQEDQIALTFDDGFSDFATVVAPLLLERGYAATLYVVAGDIGDEPNWLPDPSGRIVNRQELRQSTMPVLKSDPQPHPSSTRHPQRRRRPSRDSREQTNPRDRSPVGREGILLSARLLNSCGSNRSGRSRLRLRMFGAAQVVQAGR